MNTSPIPQLSLILVSYNTKDLLRQCLASVAKHEPSAQVIVVDNGSKDGSAEMVEAEFADAVVIQMGWNAGFAAANNAGLAKSNGRCCVLLNSDTVLEDDTLSRAAHWLDQNPKVGATSPKLMGIDGNPQACLYDYPTLIGFVREAFRGSLVANPNGPKWLAGTALMIKREALESIGGGLDDRFWMYWEDADLSARLLEKGWKIEPFLDGQIIHYGGASGGGADLNRRADLHAWYVFGKHRWFIKHRPLMIAGGVWLLDFIDIGRMWARGLIRTHRPRSRDHAKVTAQVLFGLLTGKRPPVPGVAKA